jgi:hypothetical protein
MDMPNKLIGRINILTPCHRAPIDVRDETLITCSSPAVCLNMWSLDGVADHMNTPEGDGHIDPPADTWLEEDPSVEDLLAITISSTLRALHGRFDPGYGVEQGRAAAKSILAKMALEG